MSDHRARVAIIGANFAGLAAARRLSTGHSVTLLDPQPAFEFLPNIHELVSGVKKPPHLRLSRETLTARAGHRWRPEAVKKLHVPIGQLELISGERLTYDACVIACGGVNTDFGIPGVREHTLPFKSVEECSAIGDRLAELEQRGRAADVVIIGGGFEGVECLGEILRRYRHNAAFNLHLVEAGGRVMPESPPCIDAAVRGHCEGLPVTFHCGVPVSRVSRTRVTLADGSILRSDLTLWTAGAAPAPLLLDSGLAPDRRAWAPVNDCLQSVAAPNVFIA
ncbi:MAG: FAD-dependent oxidoreductase, partial [Chromatocurvus sp.]